MSNESFPKPNKAIILFGMFADMFQRVLVFPQLRVAFLKLLGANIGKNSQIGSLYILNPFSFKRFNVGDNVGFAPWSLIDLTGKIKIGNNVTFGSKVSIFTHQHPAHCKLVKKKYPNKISETVIGNDVYVGTGATILSGVKIGNQVVIGAGAVVTKNIPSNVVVGGVPAKRIKKLRT